MRDGIQPRELAEAKKAYLEGMKQSRASDPQLANALQHGLHVGRTFDYYAELEKKIDTLTPEQVTAAFRKYLDAKKLVIVEAGDFKAKPKSEK